MQHSENVNELFTALAKAQGTMRAAKKSGKNPRLGNGYATLDDIIETIRKPLSSNGLAYMQLFNDGENYPILETILTHSSGQWIVSSMPMAIMSPQNKAVTAIQALGSTLTYMKRYALSAMLGVSSDPDDDGNGAPQKRKPQQKAPRSPKPPLMTIAVANKVTTAQGTPLGDLDAEQLEIVIQAYAHNEGGLDTVREVRLRAARLLLKAC